MRRTHTDRPSGSFETKNPLSLALTALPPYKQHGVQKVTNDLVLYTKL